MTRRIGVPLIRLGHVGSTMDELAVLAERGAEEGTAVLAEVQTAGRGRAGRAWQSTPGTSILLSVLLRPTVPQHRLGTLPLVIGLAVAEAVEEETGLSPRLKWPNDLLLNGRKMAGILTSARAAGTATRVIVGVGVNVNARLDQLPENATSLQVESGDEQDRERLLDAILARLDAAYRHFERAGGSFDQDAWRRRAAFLGELVCVEAGDLMLDGILAGVDGDGALILKEPGGERRRVVVGDVTRGPRLLGHNPT
jgi:BirA family biotin operon repressor/biotin-[acetyl-CoA-carboxylase] ligase